MADKAIGDLLVATSINDSDKFVLEQGDTAKSLTGKVLRDELAVKLKGHGGIYNIAYDSTDGLVDTYKITYTTDADIPGTEKVPTFTVTNAKSITGVTKGSTSGLTTTYNVNYNSGDPDTFTVTDGVSAYCWIKYSTAYPTKNSDMHDFTDNYIGVYSGTSATAPEHYTDYEWFKIKGEKGDNTYTWIKYSSTQPTKNADMHDTADKWIGIYYGSSSTAPTAYTAYAPWYEIKGEKGDLNAITGTPQYRYADGGTNGSTPPTTETDWKETPPTVAAGNYLWSRTKITYSDNTTVTSYNVARQGHDGTGAVNSVNAQGGDIWLYGSNVQMSSSDLTTISSAISSLSTDIGKRDVLVVTIEGISGTENSTITVRYPNSGTNNNIEDDMVCVHSELSNPSAQGDDWTITTSTGYLTITGTFVGTSATNATLYLMKQR